MRFAFWYYIGKFTIIGLCLSLISFVISSKIPIIYEYFFAPVGVVVGVTFVVLGVTGAILAIMGVFGKMPPMYCPFCGRPGEFDYQKYSSDKEHSGLLLYCDRCGVIHGAGFLGLRLEKSPQSVATEPSIKRTKKRNKKQKRHQYKEAPDVNICKEKSWNWDYARKWKYVRWFLLLWMPMLGSYLWTILILTHHIGFSTLIMVIGTSALWCVYGAVCAGFSTGNWGVLDRDKKPFLFWLSNLIFFGSYVALIIALWSIGKK